MLTRNINFKNFFLKKNNSKVKKDLKKQKKAEKIGWKDFLEFWPMSIVVPGMLLLILWGSYAF